MKAKYKQGETLGTVEKVKTKHEEIAQKIIDSLESNNIPWKKPWTSLNPKNLVTQKEYRGINTVLLSMVPSSYPFFATFNQVKAAGGSIKKGSKSVPVYFYSPVSKTVEENGEEKESRYFLMKQYNVFTCDDIEGIDFSLFIDPVLDFKPVFQAETLINSYLEAEKIKLLQGSGAAYSIMDDYIVMPKKETFYSEDAYYSTIFHEMTHSTRHKNRTARDIKPNQFGSKDYTFEELVAEFGAAMLATYCGVSTQLEEGQNAAYIKSWLKNIKEDPTIVYKAASKAQNAVDYILKAAGMKAFEETENQEEQSTDQTKEAK